MKPKEKETLYTHSPQRMNHTLPKEVGEALRSLGLKERKAYATELSNAGWTLQSIANELNITRESIRLYGKATSNNESEVRKAIAGLPIPPMPIRTVSREVFKKVAIPDDVLAELKELYEKAKLVRGKSKKYRKEAEDFTKLAHEQIEKGVSTYALSKALGITNSALLFRFARYGYKTSEGQSKVYRQLTNRYKEEGEANAELV